MTLPSGRGLKGGILTYNHWGWTAACCSYRCGNIIGRCFGCSRDKCGIAAKWKNPNTHQPYLCLLKNKPSRDSPRPSSSTNPSNLSAF